MTSLKRLILLLAAAIVAVVSLPASGSGSLRVRNFPHSLYDGGTQNWDTAQDSLGRLYVANRDGLLCFDGQRWSKYVLPNYSAVRSLLYDPENDRIYAAGTEEFGYFQPDGENGALRYRSLVPKGDARLPRFTEIWNIFRQGNSVWFQADNYIFRHDGKKLAVISAPARISCSALIAERIYAGLENGNVAVLEGSRLRILPGSHVTEVGKIRAILPYRETILAATSVDGLFILDGDAFRPFDSDISAFLRQNQLFCAVARGDDYVFGTVTQGAVVKNFATGRTLYLNKEQGMQNNTVLHASFDRAGNIWLCLDNGLDYALYDSPVTDLIGAANDIGTGYAALRYGDTVYFGTNQGLFSTPYPFSSSPSPLPLERRIQGQIWSITPVDGGFFAAGDAGAFVSDGTTFYRIPSLTGTYMVRPAPGHPDTAIASSYDGYHLLRRENGRWREDGKIRGETEVKGTFKIDGNGDLWISHWLKGIYRLRLDVARRTFARSRHFTASDGLPSTSDNSVAIYQGRAVAVSPQGFFSLDRTGRVFRPDKELDGMFGGISPLSLHNGADGPVIIGREGIMLSPEGPMLRSLNDQLVSGYEHIALISPQEMLIANQNGFWSVDPQKDHTSGWHPLPYVSAISANGDSAVYRARGNAAALPLTLPYDLNSLRFDFAEADFAAHDGVHYSSMLENYDKDWCPLSAESSREYTRLAEGRYTLRLRAVCLRTGRTSETAFSFVILPPWYRSTYAKIIYALFILAVTATLIHFINRWKKNAERRMALQKEEEMEQMRRQARQEALRKDFEIATLKSEQLEIDIRHKSSELSNAAMNVIRKNEILNEIASKIAKIQADASLGSGVQKQLTNIQQSIGQNISHDDDWKTFNHNFDIVYGDYTKRLHKRYPQLTQADIRLCCYIKMGLSSKEIAPLVNISFKSVEMARYRLRKKMELAPGLTLSDCLADF